ncbi:MAG: Antibiotic biosynthesis monooxygenase, partial [uncultured Corynebacteriales bacterium]
WRSSMSHRARRTRSSRRTGRSGTRWGTRRAAGRCAWCAGSSRPAGSCCSWSGTRSPRTRGSARRTGSAGGAAGSVRTSPRRRRWSTIATPT